MQFEISDASTRCVPQCRWQLRCQLSVLHPLVGFEPLLAQHLDTERHLMAFMESLPKNGRTYFDLRGSSLFQNR